MDIKEQDKIKIISLINTLIPNAKIYLFGSFAANTNIPGSDLDIAIDTGSKIERAKIGEIRDVLNATNMVFKFDIVDLNNVPEKMKYMILKEGILWKN